MNFAPFNNTIDSSEISKELLTGFLNHKISPELKIKLGNLLNIKGEYKIVVVHQPVLCLCMNCHPACTFNIVQNNKVVLHNVVVSDDNISYDPWQ